MKENKKTNNNMTAALTYLLGPVTGIIFFLIEKDDKFVRFHAFQSILLGVVMIALNYLIGTFYIPGLTGLLSSLVSLGSFVLWLYLMYQAYNGEKYELPYLGKIANEQANK